MRVFRVEHEDEPLLGTQIWSGVWTHLPPPQTEGITIDAHEVCACKDIKQFKLWWNLKNLKRMSAKYVVVELEATVPRNKKGIKQVVFDRNGFIYHGRVQALADGAREAGLNF